MAAATILVVLAILLDLTSSYSSFQIGQLVLSFTLAIAGALVGLRGVIDFLSDKF